MYWEVALGYALPATGTHYDAFGICTDQFNPEVEETRSDHWWGFRLGQMTNKEGSAITCAQGDRIGFLANPKANTLTVYQNGSRLRPIFFVNPGVLFPCMELCTCILGGAVGDFQANPKLDAELDWNDNVIAQETQDEEEDPGEGVVLSKIQLYKASLLKYQRSLRTLTLDSHHTVLSLEDYRRRNLSHLVFPLSSFNFTNVVGGN